MEMICYLFVVVAVIGNFYSVQSAWQNKLDKPHTVDCPYGQSVFKLRSQHRNHEEDRFWEIKCRNSGVNGHCFWTEFINSFDGYMSYQCPNNAVISGMYSEHDNHHEDRKFKVKCCSITGRTLTGCYTTPFINNWDQYFNYIIPNGQYLAGLQSIHHNHHEDRRFKLYLCNLH